MLITGKIEGGVDSRGDLITRGKALRKDRLTAKNLKGAMGSGAALCSRRKVDMTDIGLLGRRKKRRAKGLLSQCSTTGLPKTGKLASIESFSRGLSGQAVKVATRRLMCLYC